MIFRTVRSWLGIFLAAGVVGFFSIGRASAQQTTQPTTEPTTRPVGNDPSARRPGPTMVLQRFKTAINQLDLTDDQKTKVEQILNDAAQKAEQMTADFQEMPPRDRYEKLIAFFQDIHQQLAGVLSGDQIKSLDGKVGPGLAQPNRQGLALLGYLQDAISRLDLSADQKDQVQKLLDSARQKAQDLQQRASNGEDVQADMQALRRDVRMQLQSILTPDQLQNLIDQMPRAQQRLQVVQPPNTNVTEANGKQPQTRPADLQSFGPDTGDAAPDVSIIELNGHTFTPAKYKGHVMVLEFGSLSCPSFRDHVGEMEKLKAAEGQRAFIVIVYTREAFPAGGKEVDRNEEDHISVPAAETLDQRKAAAADAMQKLNITIPMAVDSMDDAVADAFGGFPNGAVVIGKDGRIAVHEKWTNPDSLRRAIDEANQK